MQCHYFGIFYILPNQQLFRKHAIFSLLIKCVRSRWNCFATRVGYHWSRVSAISRQARHWQKRSNPWRARKN